jgi:endonuclease YncB( thermonuclease family)
MPGAPFRAVAGRYVVTDYEPDGDSMRFIPHDPSLLDGLPNHEFARPNQYDHSLQLRFEGIDAPELHFGGYAQVRGDTARDRLLGWMGFEVKLEGPAKVASSRPHFVEGTILTRAFDGHGRVLAYVLIHPCELRSGQEVTEEACLPAIAASMNGRLVAEGEAYPLAYSGTPREHTHWMREKARAARDKRRGVWAHDATAEFPLVDYASITAPSGKLIYPKFFRRCIECLGTPSYAGELVSWLRANDEENDHLLLHGEERRLDSLFTMRKHVVTVDADVTDLVFIGK